MDRPAWQRLWRDLLAGKISKLVCWRIDRLGRTARGLLELRDELVERRIGFLSLREGLDLETPSGRRGRGTRLGAGHGVDLLECGKLPQYCWVGSRGDLS
jgi:DNA invertase Pin-like site-specific DNA recombinase